jgi:hypothetical protein
MRKRFALVVAGLLVAGGGVIASFVASPSATAATTFTVIERFAKGTFLDLGDQGYSQGDMSVFHNKIYDEANTTMVGRDQGLCTVISTKQHSWECISTIFVEDGASSITVENPFYDTKDSVGAVTGGTGTYSGASGTFTVGCTDGDCTSGEYTFVFSLS